MTTRSALRRRWKADELRIARRLGGERVPVNGRSRGSAPDIASSWLCPEVKSRKWPLLVLQDALAQAKAAARHLLRQDGVERLPIVVYHVVGTPIDRSLVVMELRHFEAWFGDPPKPEGEEATA